MIESWSDNLEQSQFVQAIEFGVEEAFKIVESIKNHQFEKSNRRSDGKSLLSISNEDSDENNNDNEIADINEQELISKQYQLQQKAKLNEEKHVEYIMNIFQQCAFTQIHEVLTDYTHDKRSRDDAISDIRNQVVNQILKSEDKSNMMNMPSIYNYNALSEYFIKFVRKIVRELALNESKRVDGRGLDDLRAINCQVNLFNSLHGSALFQRGQTQVLCSITFDSPEAMYRSESIAHMMSPSLTNFNKSFMLHYEFPSFATNEIARVGGRADRREIGHGALAEKAVYPLVPTNFDFTIRALCEVLESNGSSSMASVCATSMALMDAGVPIQEPVCGVAMGIFTKFDEKNENIINYKILTDISGFEDYMGDTDFKIAGTLNGITAVQVRT